MRITVILFTVLWNFSCYQVYAQIWTAWEPCPGTLCYRGRHLMCDGVGVGRSCAKAVGETYTQLLSIECTSICTSFSIENMVQECGGFCYRAITAYNLNCTTEAGCYRTDYRLCYNEDRCGGTWVRDRPPGPCSVTCGGGQQSWNESCFLNEMISTECAGSEGLTARTVTEICNTQTCPAWTDWGTWQTCNASCIQARNRTCYYNGTESVLCGNNSLHIEFQYQACTNGSCITTTPRDTTVLMTTLRSTAYTTSKAPTTTATPTFPTTQESTVTTQPSTSVTNSTALAMKSTTTSTTVETTTTSSLNMTKDTSTLKESTTSTSTTQGTQTPTDRTTNPQHSTKETNMNTSSFSWTIISSTISSGITTVTETVTNKQQPTSISCINSKTCSTWSTWSLIRSCNATCSEEGQVKRTRQCQTSAPEGCATLNETMTEKCSAVNCSTAISTFLHGPYFYPVVGAATGLIIFVIVTAIIIRKCKQQKSRKSMAARNFSNANSESSSGRSRNTTQSTVRSSSSGSLQGAFNADIYVNPNQYPTRQSTQRNRQQGLMDKANDNQYVSSHNVTPSAPYDMANTFSDGRFPANEFGYMSLESQNISSHANRLENLQAHSSSSQTEGQMGDQSLELEEDKDEHTYTSIEELKKNKKLKSKRKSKKEKPADNVHRSTYENCGPEREAALGALGDRDTLARRSNRAISTITPNFTTMHASLKKQSFKSHSMKSPSRSVSMKAPRMPVKMPCMNITRNIGQSTILEESLPTHARYEDIGGRDHQETIASAYEMMDLQNMPGYTDMTSNLEQIQDVGDYSEVDLKGNNYVPMRSAAGEFVDEAYNISQ